ncbi:MAG: ribonuclease H-like domain-containing protein [bacterium]|nr:ribonuclease H-like domain-containing protein [bacterium]
MYKKLALDDILTIQTTLFHRLRSLCEQNRHQYLKGFIQAMVSESERAYFFRDNRPIFGFFPQEDGGLRLIDETEYIELSMSAADVERLHNILKDQQTMRAAQQQQTVFDELKSQLRTGSLHRFGDKPFLVYDIETTSDSRLGGQKFAIAYLLDTAQDRATKFEYEYVDEEALAAFGQRLLDYDGWIIGFNHISFDNPIVMQQAGFSSAELDVVQQKSLDPFQLVRRLTGRRMSLNAMATALLGVGKTLSSGAEGQQLLEKRQKTNDQKALQKVREYCKNDVEITLGVFLYMLHYQELHLDGTHYTIDEPTFLRYGTV